MTKQDLRENWAVILVCCLVSGPSGYHLNGLLNGGEDQEAVRRHVTTVAQQQETIHELEVRIAEVKNEVKNLHEKMDRIEDRLEKLQDLILSQRQ